MNTNTAIRGITVDEEGRERSLADEAGALKAGFSPAQPLFSVGTMVIQSGVNNFRISRDKFENRPMIGPACDSLIEKVSAEVREDIKAVVPTLYMTPNGLLDAPLGTFSMTERAFEGLCGFATPGGGSYLSHLGKDVKGLELRANNLNYWLPKAQKLDKVASKKSDKEVVKDKEVTLRTRVNDKQVREVFATVGPRYAKHDVDAIMGQLKSCKAIPSDARVSVVYDGFKATVDVLFHSNIQPENCVAGEFFMAGIRITTADDGTGAIKIKSLVFRNLCLNLIVIDVDEVLTLKKRHVGKGIHAAVEAGIEDAYRRVEFFAKKWSDARLENVLERYGKTSPQEVFEGLVANGLVNIPGVSDEEMTQRLMTAWASEGGYSKADFVNAVTKAAHTSSWTNYQDSETLEETGGNLLFAKLWVVDMPEKATEEQLLG